MGLRRRPCGPAAPPVVRREPGQDAVVLEPGDVRRVAGEHRRPGGRAQHAGRADLRADQGVDERGLARAGGAADDHEQRRVHARQARQEVVVDLAGDLVARPPAGLGARRGEPELEPAQLVAQGGEAPGRPGGLHVGGHWGSDAQLPRGKIRRTGASVVACAPSSSPSRPACCSPPARRRPRRRASSGSETVIQYSAAAGDVVDVFLVGKPDQRARRPRARSPSGATRAAPHRRSGPGASTRSARCAASSRSRPCCGSPRWRATTRSTSPARPRRSTPACRPSCARATAPTR